MALHERISNVVMVVDVRMLVDLVLESWQSSFDGVEYIADSSCQQLVESLGRAPCEGHCRGTAVSQECLQRLRSGQHGLLTQLLQVALKNWLTLRCCLLTSFAKCKGEPFRGTFHA